MIDNLTAIGYGIIGFAVVIGIGIVVLASLSGAIAGCTTVGGGTATYNASDGLCTNASGSTGNPSTATTNLNTITNTYIGTNLVSWIPVVIVLVIGMLFLGAFLLRKGKAY